MRRQRTRPGGDNDHRPYPADESAGVSRVRLARLAGTAAAGDGRGACPDRAGGAAELPARAAGFSARAAGFSARTADLRTATTRFPAWSAAVRSAAGLASGRGGI